MLLQQHCWDSLLFDIHAVVAQPKMWNCWHLPKALLPRVTVPVPRRIVLQWLCPGMGCVLMFEMSCQIAHGPKRILLREALPRKYLVGLYQLLAMGTAGESHLSHAEWSVVISACQLLRQLLPQLARMQVPQLAACLCLYQL